jgi:hypothetical protein
MCVCVLCTDLIYLDMVLLVYFATKSFGNQYLDSRGFTSFGADVSLSVALVWQNAANIEARPGLYILIHSETVKCLHNYCQNLS